MYVLLARDPDIVCLVHSPYREEKPHIGDIMAAFAPYFKVCLCVRESFYVVLYVNILAKCQNVSTCLMTLEMEYVGICESSVAHVIVLLGYVRAVVDVIIDVK